MRPISIIYFLLPFLASSQIKEGYRLDKELFVCYGKIAPATVQGYDMVIIEAQHYSASEIETFKIYNHRVLAYISLTEVHQTADHFTDIKPFSFGKNENWNSRYIDISNKKAQEIILNAISKLTKKGFDGFFLDNLDNASKWGELKANEKDLVQLIKRIKRKNQNTYLVQNAGLFIAKRLKKVTDAILLESVLTAYDFNQKAYGYRDEKSKIRLIDEITVLSKILKKPVVLVEYVDDLATKDIIETDLRELGFGYFIANIDLQAIPQFSD